MDDQKIIETATMLRNEYYKEWRKLNKERVKRAQKDYWERKAVQHLKELEERAKEGKTENEGLQRHCKENRRHGTKQAGNTCENE